MADHIEPRDTLQSLFEELLKVLEELPPEVLEQVPGDLLKRVKEYHGSHGCNLTEFVPPPELYLQTCVLDEGKPWDCVFATLLEKEGKGKESCKHWAENHPPYTD